MIAAAQGVSATIHSIAFFTSGGGLEEIAGMTGGTYQEIHGEADLAAGTAPSTAPSSGGGGSDDSSSDDDDDDSDGSDSDDNDGDNSAGEGK